MSKEIKVNNEEEMKWKVDDAIRAFSEFKRLTQDEKVKEKTIKELKKRADEYKELAKEL